MDAPLYPASRVSNAEPSLDTRRVPDDGAVLVAGQVSNVPIVDLVLLENPAAKKIRVVDGEHRLGWLQWFVRGCG